MDSPVGAGYSYSEVMDESVWTDTVTVNHLHTFIRKVTPFLQRNITKEIYVFVSLPDNDNSIFLLFSGIWITPSSCQIPSTLVVIRTVERLLPS